MQFGPTRMDDACRGRRELQGVRRLREGAAKARPLPARAGPRFAWRWRWWRSGNKCRRRRRGRRFLKKPRERRIRDSNPPANRAIFPLEVPPGYAPYEHLWPVGPRSLTAGPGARLERARHDYLRKLRRSAAVGHPISPRLGDAKTQVARDICRGKPGGNSGRCGNRLRDREG